MWEGTNIKEEKKQSEASATVWDKNQIDIFDPKVG